MAAVAILVAASVSNAFSQESQLSGETAPTNSTTSSSPLEPSSDEQVKYEKLLNDVDKILAGREDAPPDLERSYFPRVLGGNWDLLETTLGKFTPADFNPTVVQVVSFD